ncbi:hypothetical protein Bca52824_037274 [Brassica carinata]|uniref:LysM domain-containing protein n=1 Tax=Brassica carinata TaxID=52824 RepID=A0A8X7S6J9_BRACI|nr:hypothetical protein Bca52824_037274 [Brassica carinata]
MFMDRERRLSNRNGTPEYSNGKFRDDNNGYGGFLDRFLDDSPEKSPSRSKILRIPSPTSSPPPSSSSPPFPGSNSPDRGYIEHRVSKFDTLAGIAIKYGVEVADVKKMNGLVTDLQMFALKSLQIPLPGRHPPSPCLSNGSLHHGEGCSCHELEPPNDSNNDVFDSFQSLRLKSSDKKVSPAMSSLQGYYGLKPADRTVSKEDSWRWELTRPKLHIISPATVPMHFSTRLTNHRTTTTTPLRKRVPISLEGDAKIRSRFFVPDSRASVERREHRKRLSFEIESLSRTNLSSAESETSNFNPVPINLMDAPVSDSFSSVRKSSSASSIQDPEGNNSSNGSSSLSLWPTSKWSLKPDLLTPAAITSSIFDGLPKPLTGRKTRLLWTEKAKGQFLVI